ncbi:MAG: hypothetical protein AAGN35_17445 [Bacteroidota bacterium]
MNNLAKMAAAGFLICSLLNLTSCQSPILQESPSLPTLQAEQVQPPCHGQAGSRNFDLDTTTNVSISFPTEGPIKYGAYLGSYPPFEEGRTCMCKIKHYAMEFDFLPGASDIYVYNGNGAELSFNGPFDLDNDGSNDAIQIPGFYIHQHVYIGFNALIDPSPELLRAGGLCMIENLSSPIEAVLRTTFVERQNLDPLGNVIGIDYYIPASSATAGPIIP